MKTQTTKTPFRRLATRRLVTTCAAAMICAASLTGAGAQAYADTEDLTCPTTDGCTITRLYGEEAPGTAAAIATKAYEGNTSEYAVLATTSSFHDSMSATGLAGALDAPILLTSKDTLSTDTLDTLNSLSVKTVYIAGGSAAISTDVENTLKTKGFSVVRVWGQNAADTSYECAKKIAEVRGDDAVLDTAIIATSGTFQDAVSMSSYAYEHKAPIFLEMGAATADDANLTKDSIKALTTGAYKDAKVFVAGGTAAVSKASVEKVRTSGNYERIWGDNAYATSAEIAKRFYSNAATICLATGVQECSGLDALAGSGLAGKIGSPILLVDGHSVDYTSIDNYLNAIDTSVIQKTYVLGGATVMPTVNSVIEHVANMLNVQLSPTPAHEHSWYPVYTTVHHDAVTTQETEQEPIYGTVSFSVCNICGADCSDNEWQHAKQHMMNGESGGHHEEFRTGITGYNTVTHTVVIQDAYDEQVLDRYACSCGATQ